MGSRKHLHQYASVLMQWLVIIIITFMRKEGWYLDNYFPDTHVMHRIRQRVIKKKTKYQTIEIVDLYDFGRSLFIDGNPQSCEASEWIYHECLVHPPLLLGPEIKRKSVLVLGAGEGATARELLKYKNVSDITLVDIDEEAVEIFKKYLPMMHKGSFENPKAKIVIDNAGDFLKKDSKKYDVIIFDITDHDFLNLGARALRTEERFYSLIAERIKKNGLFAMHAGGLNEESECKTHTKLRNFLKKIFPSVYSYRAYIPFFENEWGFLLASRDKNFCPQKFGEKIIKKRISKYGLRSKLDYFNPGILKASFIFPPRLENIFKSR